MLSTTLCAKVNVKLHALARPFSTGTNPLGDEHSIILGANRKCLAPGTVGINEYNATFAVGTGIDVFRSHAPTELYATISLSA